MREVGHRQERCEGHHSIPTQTDVRHEGQRGVCDLNDRLIYILLALIPIEENVVTGQRGLAEYQGRTGNI